MSKEESKGGKEKIYQQSGKTQNCILWQHYKSVILLMLLFINAPFIYYTRRLYFINVYRLSRTLGDRTGGLLIRNSYVSPDLCNSFSVSLLCLYFSISHFPISLLFVYISLSLFLFLSLCFSRFSVSLSICLSLSLSLYLFSFQLSGSVSQVCPLYD